MDLCWLAIRISQVRASRAMLLAALAAAGLLAVSASAGGGTSGACAGRLAGQARRLPAPITIAAGHIRGSVSYRIGCHGRVHRMPKTQTPFTVPRDEAFEGNGIWFAVRHDHLVIGRGRKPLWRSHARFPSPAHRPIEIGGLTVGRDTLAFAYHNTLYLAPLTGAERPVAHGEFPLGFTTGGVYTYRWNRALLLRSFTGAVVKTIARWPFDTNFQAAGGNVYFIAHDALIRAQGTRIQRLASLTRLGLSAGPWLQSLGPLVELQDNRRLVVVRPDGSVFASTRLPRSRGHNDTISSSVAIAPHATAVAFTAASGLSDDSNTTGPTPGSETIYLLRPGARTATLVHRERVEFEPCIGEGATLQWRGRWLLYNGANSHAAAIDTASPHRTIELRKLLRGLTGTRDGFTAYWSDQPPPL